MRRLIAEVFARHRALAWVGALNLVAAGVCLLLLLIDDTTVLGVNRWLKPFKFGSSVGIYLWTVAWILPSLGVKRRMASALGWGIAIALFFENALIFMQAIRGRASHFNLETAFDGSVFSLMGLLIGINSVLLAILLLLFLVRPNREMPRPWIWSIRIGLVLLILGSAQGGYMIASGGHSVGADDGGPGMPVTHWNTESGDHRPAHLIGIHGIQLLPLFAWWLGRRGISEGTQMTLVLLASAAYTALGFALFFQAASGQPMLTL